MRRSLECLGDWEKKPGYEEVDSLICPDQCYSFDDFGVLRGPDGRYWYGRTSGCSCPGHWHEYEYDDETFDTNLEPLNAQTFAEFERQVYAWDGKVPLPERRDFIEKIRGIVTAVSSPHNP